MIPPCAVTFVRVHCHIFICTLLTMAVCMEDLDSAVLCDLEAKDSAKTRKESIYEAFILAAYGFWQLISRVTKL